MKILILTLVLRVQVLKEAARRHSLLHQEVAAVQRNTKTVVIKETVHKGKRELAVVVTKGIVVARVGILSREGLKRNLVKIRKKTITVKKGKGEIGRISTEKVGAGHGKVVGAMKMTESQSMTGDTVVQVGVEKLNGGIAVVVAKHIVTEVTIAAILQVTGERRRGKGRGHTGILQILVLRHSLKSIGHTEKKGAGDILVHARNRCLEQCVNNCQCLIVCAFSTKVFFEFLSL